MRFLYCLIVVGVQFVASTSFSAAVAADGVRFVREERTVFLKCDDVAHVMEFEFKVVTPRRLVTFCKGGANGICIPVRLSPENHRGSGNVLMIAADVLASALRFSVREENGKITIAERFKGDGAQQDTIPAYNAAWQKGRGFRKGETVPDIPLVDLEGNEVRFSNYLGKRYILYCWASW